MLTVDKAAELIRRINSILTQIGGESHLSLIIECDLEQHAKVDAQKPGIKTVPYRFSGMLGVLEKRGDDKFLAIGAIEVCEEVYSRLCSLQPRLNTPWVVWSVLADLRFFGDINRRD